MSLKNIILIISLIPYLLCCLKVKGQHVSEADSQQLALFHNKFTHHHYSHLDSALYFARKAYALARDKRLFADEAKAMNNVGKAYYTKGDYLLSLEASTKALELSRKYHVPQETSESYNTIGLIYLAQNKYDAAIPQLKKAVKVNQEIRSVKGLTTNFFNLAVCYDYMMEPDSALFYLTKSESLARRANNKAMLVMSLNRRGEIYYHMSQFDKAKSFYEKALADPAVNQWERCFANTGLGKVYFEKTQYQQAIHYSQTGLELATQIDAKWDAKNAAEVLSKAYAALGDYKNAYTSHVLFKRLEDSLLNQAKENEINYRHLVQQTAENRQLAKENQIKRQENKFNRLVIFGVSGMCILLVAGAIIIYLKNREHKLLNLRLSKNNRDIAVQRDTIERQNEELSRLNQTKNQLFSIMAHDLRGPLSSIQQAVQMMMEGNFSPEERDYILKGYYQEIVLVNNMVNNMLNWALSQQFGIRAHLIGMDLARSIEEIMGVQQLIARNKGVVLRSTIESESPLWIEADPDQVRVIIQNLITNGIKFTESGGEVQVYCSQDAEHVHLHVKDTGIGIPPSKMDILFKEVGKNVSAYGTQNESGTGIGLMLVKNFTEANGGKFAVQSKPNEGAHFTISFRKAG